MKLVHEMLQHRALRAPDALAMQDIERSISYEALLAAVTLWAKALIGRGLKKQDRVMICLPNSVNFIVAHFAVLSAGGVSVPTDFQASSATLERILENASPFLVITTAKLHGQLAVLPITSQCLFLVVDDAARTLSLECELKTLASGVDLPNDIKQDDLATLMYTTGSTGQPKGVMLTHRNILAALNNICQFVGYTASDREVIVLPLSHNFGLGHAYCNLMSGGAFYTEPGMTHLKRVLSMLESFGATGFPGTPMSVGILMDRYRDIFVEKAKHLRFMVVNSAPLPKARTMQLRETFPTLNLMVYYGLTEASRSTFISLSEKGEHYAESVGRPMPGVKLLIHPETSEILLAGETVSAGYWGLPEETAVMFKDGYLATGDLGYQDELGYLFVTGRLKEIMNIGGLKVSPVEVEDALKQYPGILDAGVLSVAASLGEYIIAGIVLAPTQDFCVETCQQFLTNCLEAFKVPRKIICIKQVPRSETGKIQRNVLKELLLTEMKTHAEY